MKKLLGLSLMILVFGAVSACSTKIPDLKSPCAGLEGSPCGPKKSVNDWWAKV